MKARPINDLVCLLVGGVDRVEAGSRRVEEKAAFGVSGDRDFEMREWMELLACPKCGGDLLLESFQWADDRVCQDGVLICKGCGQWYPISNRVPRLFPPGPVRPDDRAFL